jgi:hypothetical protein
MYPCPICRDHYSPGLLWIHLEQHGILPNQPLPHGIRSEPGAWQCCCGEMFREAEDRARHFHEHGETCLFIGVLLYG